MSSLVKSRIKFIKNLYQKKYRTQHGMFVVEGIKTVNELLASNLKVDEVYTTDPDIFDEDRNDVTIISGTDLKKMSGLRSPNTVLGIFHIPEPKELDFSDWVVALDDVRDPGNLGTIIRLCDWFGIRHLICSPSTVDCYNPKVLQATMGSISRINVVYADIMECISKSKTQVYGAFMDGVSVYSEQLPKKGILVLGNEANGISEKITDLIDRKIAIPQPASRTGRFGKETAESLNVATATAILLNEIRRATQT